VVLIEEICDGFGAANRIGKVVEPEFEEALARFGFTLRLFQQPWNIRQPERYANPWKGAPVRHLVHQNSR
jgi:hypothetical protein